MLCCPAFVQTALRQVILYTNVELIEYNCLADRVIPQDAYNTALHGAHLHTFYINNFGHFGKNMWEYLIFSQIITIITFLFGPIHVLYFFRKSQQIWENIDKYFGLWAKYSQGVGRYDPPPGGIGLN